MTTPQLNAPPKLYIPVAGTWARREFRTGEWYRTDSPFDKQMTQLGYDRVDQNGDPNRPDPGFWSGDVNGLLVQKLNFWRRSDTEWRLGGGDLASFITKRYHELAAADEVAIIAHSHGGQVVAFALTFLADTQTQLPNFRVVTVDTPVRTGRVLGFLWRRSMDKIYQRASGAIDRRWDHLYSERFWRQPLKSHWRWLGSQFGPRRLECARSNRKIPGGHSDVLNKWLYLWGQIMSGQGPLVW